MATCTHCGNPLDSDALALPCSKCKSLVRTLHPEPVGLRLLVGFIALQADAAQVAIQAKTESGLATRLAARLDAITRAAQQLEESIVDRDGRHAIVEEAPLMRAIGFARRDRQDLRNGKL